VGHFRRADQRMRFAEKTADAFAVVELPFANTQRRRNAGDEGAVCGNRQLP